MESPEAQNLLKQLEDAPENWDIRCKAAERLLMEGWLGEACALLDSAPNPPQYETHILKIAEIYSATNPGRAVPMLHEFLTLCPESAVGHLAMSELAAKLGDLNGATQYYRRALEINKSYRDPDFEKKYDVSVEDPPTDRPPEKVPAPTPLPKTMVKTESIPLPTAADTLGPLDEEAEEDADVSTKPAAPEPSTATDQPEAKEPRPAEAESKSERPGSSAAEELSPATASRRKRSKSKPRSAIGWVVATLSGVAVFVLCWLILLVVIKALLAGD